MQIIVNLLCVMCIIGVHEYGHFYFAKRFGVSVPSFSVGLGPKLFSFMYHETNYSLRLIPFGGFVVINQKQVERLSAWRQIQISFGGPLANLLLCIAVGVLALLFGYTPKFLAHAPWYQVWLAVTVGTTVLFFFLVPMTLYALVDILIHPVANFSAVSGPIGIVNGDAVPSAWISDQPVGIQILIIIYVLSLSLGTLNLVPVSMLDGGKIFRVLFSRFPRFIVAWDWVTGIFLGLIVVYFLGGDLIKLGFRIFSGQ